MSEHEQAFKATATMKAFMLSSSHVRVLAGPIGAGKSVCCAHELMRWAIKQEPDASGMRRTRFLVVRNTVDQLKSTTLKTIVDWFPPTQFGHYKVTDKTLHYELVLSDGTTVKTEWMLIALDTPDDVRKALSLECTGLWGNECRELHPEVVDGLLMRVDRYPSMKDGGATRAGAIFDTNMPTEGTWWERQMTEPPANWSVHIQPPAVLPVADWTEKYGEDPPEDICATTADGEVFATDPEADNYANLSRSYYPNTLEGKKDDFVRVYLRSQFGRSLGGLPVYDKTFKPERHVAQEYLEPIRSDSYPLCVGVDFGRTPAAAIMQLTPSGRVMILSEITSENMGIQTFVQTLLRPHLFERYAGVPLYLAPDPAGWQKTQLGEMSPIDYLRSAGFRLVRPPTNDPKRRIEAFERLLTGAVDSSPMLQIDPRCTVLLRGMRGEYKWKTNRAGELAGDTSPVKNFVSHIAEAAQYGALVIDQTLQGAHDRNQRREIVFRSAGGWT